MVRNVKCSVRVRAILIIDKEGVVLGFVVDQVSIEQIIMAENHGRIEGNEVRFQGSEFLVKFLHVKILGEDALDRRLAVRLGHWCRV